MRLSILLVEEKSLNHSIFYNKKSYFCNNMSMLCLNTFISKHFQGRSIIPNHPIYHHPEPPYISSPRTTLYIIIPNHPIYHYPKPPYISSPRTTLHHYPGTRGVHRVGYKRCTRPDKISNKPEHDPIPERRKPDDPNTTRQ